MAKKFTSFKQLTAKEPDHVLVYSTEPVKAKVCIKCSEPEEKCQCQLLEIKAIGKVNPNFRIEKKGRGGKVVTVLSRLPANKIFLKDFCKYLKNAAGTGGTYYIDDGNGMVEIQGERIPELTELSRKYTFK